MNYFTGNGRIIERSCLLLLIMLLGFSATASAQQLSTARVGIDESNPLSLSLNDAIRLALENNSEIEVERVNVQQAGADLTTARGSYDPVLNFTYNYLRQNIPITSTLGGSTTGVVTTDSLTGVFGLRGLLSTGGNYEINANQARTTNSSFFSTLDPQMTTNLGFTFTQPLLRNRKVDDPRHRISVAQRKLDISDSLFRQRVIEIIAKVESAYWDLTFALRNVDIAKESVALAQTQYDRAKRLVEAGTQAPIDLVQVEAQLKLRQEDLLVAIEGVTRSENAFKILVLANRTAPEWQRPILPTDNADVKFDSFDLESSVSTALANRPELKQLDTQAEIVNEDIKYLKNQTKPQVDLIANYTLSGLAGSVVSRDNPFSTAASLGPLLDQVNKISSQLGLSQLPGLPVATQPGFLVGGNGQSLANLFRDRFNTLRVGVTISLPLKNRTAQGQLARAQFESRKATVTKQQTEQVVEQEVRNALQSVRTTQERIEASRAARIAAEKQLESEQRRYEAGLSTNFLVLTRQDELAQARGRELRALTDYDKALAELQRATGTTLNLHNVDVKSPRPPDDK